MIFHRQLWLGLSTMRRIVTSLGLILVSIQAIRTSSTSSPRVEGTTATTKATTTLILPLRIARGGVRRGTTNLCFAPSTTIVAVAAFARNNAPKKPSVVGTSSLRASASAAASPSDFTSSKDSTKAIASSSTTTTPPIVGTASIPASVFNLIKCIVGAGVLGLPAGIAAFGDAPSALIPALAFMAIIATLSGYSFHLIGTVCKTTQATSYGQAWERTIGPRTTWIPAAACILVTACSVLTYSIVLKQTIPDILKAVAGISVPSTAALLGVTTTVLLPLCLVKELRRLAPFSLIGILGMVYTAVMMTIRWRTGMYAVGTGTLTQVVAASAATQHLVPRFGTAGWKAAYNTNAAILISMLSTAFMAHYNGPKFYWELRNNHQPERFRYVVLLSYLGALILMGTIAVAGFATFGGASSGLILNNYAVTDTWMSLSRTAVTMSLIASYPLTFVGVKEGLLDLLQITHPTRRQQWSTPMTFILLSVITGLALVVKDIRFIMALGGATWGNGLTYLFPALMLYRLSRRGRRGQDGINSGDNTIGLTAADVVVQKQVPTAVTSGLIGLCLGLVGTARALGFL